MRNDLATKTRAAIYHEYAAVADSAALAGGKQLYVAPASVKVANQRDGSFGL